MEKVLDERHYRRYEEMFKDGTVVVEVGPEGERRLVWADVWEVDEEEGGNNNNDDDDGGGGGGGGPDDGPHGNESSVSNKPAPNSRRRRKPVDPTYGTDMLSLLGKNNGMEKDPSSGKTTFEKYLDGEIDTSQQSIFGKDIPPEYSDDEAVRAKYELSSAPVKKKKKKVGGEVVKDMERGNVNCEEAPETPEWRDEDARELLLRPRKQSLVQSAERGVDIFSWIRRFRVICC